MGVKSSRELTRAEAIERATDLKQQIERRRQAAGFHAMSNTELEEALERLNDEAAGGEGFENYIVTGE